MSDLSEQISQRLKQAPIPAAEFMELALYHPQQGYYRQPAGRWGFAGKDYYTALDVGPLMGECLCLRLESAWHRLDRPGLFTVLEPGAGRGWLGRDLLEASQGDFAEALRYLHQDDNPAARSAAEAALATHVERGRAGFAAEGEDLVPFVGAIISNELFDALPAQPWRWDGTRWVQEVLAAAGPEWQVGDPGEAAVWFESNARDLEPGDGSIWCDALPALVANLAGALARGLFLAVDYGDSAEILLGKGADLRRYLNHQVDGRWWDAPGRADLTADVDFTRLQALLEAAGLTELGQRTLSRWVREQAPLARWEHEWQALPPRDRVKRTENLLQLTMPGMLGERFRVLEGWKG